MNEYRFFNALEAAIEQKMKDPEWMAGFEAWLKERQEKEAKEAACEKR